MKSILLLVGNGLSIALRSWADPQLENWNPQTPLDWDLYTPGKPQVPLMKSLPNFAKVISSLRQQETDLSDFDIFERSLKLVKNNNSKSFSYALLEAEMQHFLAIAFSHFQLKVDKVDLSSWSWVKWLNTYRKSVHGAVSFNYDLVLESSLIKSGITICRFGLRSELIGIPILKPHGSIDFDIHGIACPVGYPMQNAIVRNNCPLRCLERAELLKPRTEADIVLPNEYSSQLDYQWIKPGYDWLRSIGHKFTHCIIIGLSYWHCDRAEIDSILNSLSPKTRLIVANPSPPPYLMQKLKKKFQKVKVWRNGPEELGNGVLTLHSET